MDPDAILAAGERARELLENPVFMDAIGGFMQLHLNAIMSSNDNDAEGREKNFRQFRAYENIAADLKERVAAADQILGERYAQETVFDIFTPDEEF